MTQLVLAGHSFGGMSTIIAAAKLSQQIKPKAVLTLDPALFAYSEELLSGQFKINCPILLINTEKFNSVWCGDFDNMGT